LCRPSIQRGAAVSGIELDLEDLKDLEDLEPEVEPEIEPEDEPEEEPDLLYSSFMSPGTARLNSGDHVQKSVCTSPSAVRMMNPGTW
jgi:hypothetical protein